MPITKAKAPKTLPSGAKTIWVGAFNSAFDGTCNEDDGCSSRVAWSAVKKRYKKVEEKWMLKEQSQASKTPHHCLKRQVSEVCPFCHSLEQVFVGHGKVRFCSDCTLSWDPKEVHRGTGRLKEQSLAKKIRSLPRSLRSAARETFRALVQANDAEGRFQALLNITDDEWEAAQEQDEE